VDLSWDYCMVCGLVARATVSTKMESQSKKRDSHLARLSFIWPRSAMFRTATFDIKVDGQVVGKIAPDSYFFVDRQASTYTLKVEPPFEWILFETHAQVTSGWPGRSKDPKGATCIATALPGPQGKREQQVTGFSQLGTLDKTRPSGSARSRKPRLVGVASRLISSGTCRCLCSVTH
jgi:hypothetical protein